MGFRVDGLNFKRSQAAVPICKDFGLSVADGETVAILGRNGCGKTTLLRLLAGLERPTSPEGSTGFSRSRVEITKDNAILVTADSRTWCECLTNHSSLVFQHTADVVFGWQTVKKALKWVRSIEDDYYLNVVAMFPALPLAESKYWGQLSGGQKQSLALARGLLRDPDILLMDESFASLDGTLRYSIEETLVKGLERLGNRHRASVLVTHNIDEAVFLANRVLIVSGPPLTTVAEIRCRQPLGLRDASYRWSDEFLEDRKRVFQEYSRLPLPTT